MARRKDRQGFNCSGQLVGVTLLGLNTVLLRLVADVILPSHATVWIKLIVYGVGFVCVVVLSVVEYEFIRWCYHRLTPPEPPTPSDEECLRIARAVCDEQGWPWDEPVVVKTRRKYREVITNTGKRGCNAWIRIRSMDGAVIEKGFAPR